MESKGLKVTIITVVYNNELIKSAIESVLCQDYSSIEYIIIDGGSKDQTLSIINNYANSIDVIVSEPDMGIYDAINKGIALASGDIIGILNSDDFLADNNVVSRIVSSFSDDVNLEALYADVIFVDSMDTNKILRYYSSKSFKPWMFRFGFQPAHPTLYVKKNVFTRVGIYKTKYSIAGDFDFLLRIFLIYKVKGKYINDLWVKMRQGGASTSGIGSVLKINSEILSICKENGVYTNITLIYSKYFVKWWGFLFKRI